MISPEVLAPRHSFRDPIPEIFLAAELLHGAVDAHLAGNAARAKALILEADLPPIAAWTESIWGTASTDIHRYRPVIDLPPILPMDLRPRPRKPTAATQRQVKVRDGRFCRFCGIPTIDRAVRKRIATAYPEEARWGRFNHAQHAAFQCMQLQYDHVLPNSRGGDSGADNIVVTCGPCNFDRMERTLEEVGIVDPRTERRESDWPFAVRWTGLEHFTYAETRHAGRSAMRRSTKVVLMVCSMVAWTIGGESLAQSTSNAQASIYCTTPGTALSSGTSPVEGVKTIAASCRPGDILPMPAEAAFAIASLCDFEKQMIGSGRLTLCVMARPRAASR